MLPQQNLAHHAQMQTHSTTKDKTNIPLLPKQKGQSECRNLSAALPSPAQHQHILGAPATFHSTPNPLHNTPEAAGSRSTNLSHYTKCTTATLQSHNTGFVVLHKYACTEHHTSLCSSHAQCFGNRCKTKPDQFASAVIHYNSHATTIIQKVKSNQIQGSARVPHSVGTPDKQPSYVI